MTDPNQPPLWQKTGYQRIWMPYSQMQTSPLPAAVVDTEGVYMTLADGQRIIDGLASWWTACHGYNHPHIIAQVERQLRQMPHVMFGGINHEPGLRLATRLAEILPGDLNRVFFSDSGSVAVEVALKIAVQYWLNRGEQGRTKFLSFRNAYHGDTTGAMAVCDPVNSMHAHFKGFLHKQFTQDIPKTAEDVNQLNDFLAKHRNEIAAVVIEPLVQGAGGMKFHTAQALAHVRDACQQHDMLLIADEIATGFGRTGTMFACEQANVVPDIICIGKALTAGTLGMAATVATDRVFDAFQSENPEHALMHGPTFMANPLACAAANASLDLFESEPRLEQVAQIEQQLRQQLQPCATMKGVVDVRSKGAVGVVQVKRLHNLDRLRSEFLKHGVWIRPFSDMIYVTPSLTIAPAELEELCTAMVAVIEEWSNWPER